MGQLCRRDASVYVVLEGSRSIGRVEAPVGEPILARGAETVLLRRGPDGGAAAAG
jgi:hypothetical protein